MNRFYTRNGLRHPFFDAARPLVFAHRGGAALAPENTIAAFDRGLAAGADGLELDVRLSSDGVAVVHHDATLERTTNLSGWVRAATADALARADAGFHFSNQQARPFRGRGYGIPRLEEVLRRYPNARVIVEIKDTTPVLARAVIDAVRRADAVERVCLGSFSFRVLRTVRALDPAIATSAASQEVRWAVYRARVRWPVRKADYGGYQVPETAGASRVVTPYFIRASHRAGLPVQVWTVNAEADARRLLEWGVAALITDRPDLIVPLVETSTARGGS
jgi:glycerophosphoryl diester phosphodiesterase